ncbi:MAG: hypothetical protein ACE5I1_17905 [bacterium]
MMEKKDSSKTFDCIEMKRKIQEQIYHDTRDLNTDGLLAYFHQQVAVSRFARFFPIHAKREEISAVESVV